MRPNTCPLSRQIPLDSKGRPRKQCCEFHRSGGKRSLWCGDQSIHDDGCPEVGCEDPTCPFRPGAQPPPNPCPYPEEFDTTDGACPAFWRGHDSGGAAVVEVIKRALTGTRHSGTYAAPALTEAVDSIYALKARLATLEQRLKNNEDQFRWAKAQKDRAVEAGCTCYDDGVGPVYGKDCKVHRIMGLAMHCEHANEVPCSICQCPENCYCRFHTCKPRKVVGTGRFRKKDRK